MDPTTLPTDIKAKLEDMVEYAKSQPIGVRHFLQVSSYPLRSVSITFHTIVGKGGHLVWQQEPQDELIIDRPDGDGYNSIGYDWYKTSLDRHNLSHTCMTKSLWVLHFDNITNKISDATHVHHGILCNKRTTESRISMDVKDKLLFHICDVIVMLYESISPTEHDGSIFNLLTTSVGGLDLGMIANDFIPTLSKEEKMFLYWNSDFIYVIFAYWANHSMLPIRLKCPPALGNAFRLSDTFRFLDHQEGKLTQLKREQRFLVDKRCFMFDL